MPCRGTQSQLSVEEYIRSRFRLNSKYFISLTYFLIRNFYVLFEDKFIQIDVYHDDLVYKQFLTSMETFKNCSYLPILNENIYKVY